MGIQEQGMRARTSSYATGVCAASRALTRFSCARLFLLDHIQQRVRYAQVLNLPPGTMNNQTVSSCRIGGNRTTHRAATDVALFNFPKAVAICTRLVYLAECDIHKVVAVDEVSVEGLPVLELDQLQQDCASVKL